MRITHMELFKIVLGANFADLERFYNEIKVIDKNDKHPLDEELFDRGFPPKTCSRIFGTPGMDRSQRNQRKMDLAVIREIYHLWKDQNYFDLSPKLCSLLVEADLKDVDTFFLRAPYRSMYLSLPKGNGIKIPNPQSGLHEVEGVYITVDDYETPRNIRILSNGQTLMSAIKHVHMVVCGEHKGPLGDAILFFDLFFFEGKISDSIKTNKDILNQPKNWEHVVEIFNFVTKVLLYINCANVSILKVAGMDIEAKLRELKNSAKKRKLLQKYTKISPQAHSFLDVSVDLDIDTDNHTDSVCRTLGPKSLEKVRAHFKTQRYGAELSKSKIILVQSYLRGEGADLYKEKRFFKII